MESLFFQAFILTSLFLLKVHLSLSCPCPISKDWEWASWRTAVFTECDCSTGRKMKKIFCHPKHPDLEGTGPNLKDAQSPESVLCEIEVECVNFITCTDSWTSWNNYGDCNVPCGSGMQEQRRTCYSSNKQRSSLCNPVSKAEEETRSVPCKKFRCQANQIPSADNKTVTQDSVDITTFAETSTTVLTKGERTENDSSNADKTRSMEVKPRNSAPEAKENQNPSQSSAVIIAAVLGSVAIIAVVMFSIALVAMVRRRQRQPQNASVQSDVISGITNLQPEHHYETVRPLSSGGSTQQRSPGRNYEVVSNQLYQPAKVNTTGSMYALASDVSYSDKDFDSFEEDDAEEESEFINCVDLHSGNYS
ncbi:uncharacterized protein LOC143448345 isoform X1 [Clavelina lepadiformis]|uniref:uncharacterized protein LOC143448345 isoform X1 n=1 Tax=Clavelina lepadiformis TaxID=159417 RepID=UPI0040414B31